MASISSPRKARQRANSALSGDDNGLDNRTFQLVYPLVTYLPTVDGDVDLVSWVHKTPDGMDYYGVFTCGKVF